VDLASNMAKKRSKTAEAIKVDKADEQTLLKPLIQDGTELRSSFKTRNSEYIFKNIHIADETEYVTDGSLKP
jgi:hypothetical protein